jgi:Cof subfamily protein (haloacid dehalogenase superfamily)
MTQETNRKPEIRLIAIDIDGTLLDSAHNLTGRVEQAVKAAVAQGAHVVLATGKTRSATLKLLDQLGIKTAGICLQGLAVYDENGSLRHQQTLTPALARQVITFAEDRGFKVLAYSENRLLSRVADQQVADGFAKYHEVAPEGVGPLQNILETTPVNKLIAFGEPRAIKALRWQLTMQIGGAGRVMQAGVPTMVEILPPGASKGMALKLLLKDMKIASENILAVGDAENDIEMIQLAGIGVAMEQAAQDVKDAADYVVASNDADGVAEALERFVLKEPLPAPGAAAPIEPQQPAPVTPENGSQESTS